MNITYYLTHNMAVRVLSIIMVVMMLMACAFVPSADAAGEGVSMALIIAILNAFGISVSSSGAIAGMTSGLSDLMEQFSQQMYDNAQHFKDMFSAHITMAGYGIAKLGSVLTDAISSFISWLKSEKSLSPSNPLVIGQSFASVTVNGQLFPVVTGSLSGDNLYFDSSSGQKIEYSQAGSPSSSVQLVSFNYPSGKNQITGIKYSTSSNPGLARTYEYSFTSSGVSGYLDGNYYRVVQTACIWGVFLNGSYAYLVGYAYKGTIPNNAYMTLNYNRRVSVSNPVINPASDWQINDDNLDLGFLDNDDGSTKDVYFTPALPDVVGQDLSTVGGLSEAAVQQLEYTYDLTGTGEIAGTMDTTSDLEPGSGGPGNVPPIVIPSHGWFRSIWHYVVKALQDSAEGIAFIIRLMQEAIPPEIVNLCWASAVLLITFGIINKFLK